MTKRLREEFAKLQVEINDEKSRIVDLERGESFGFLGFDFRYLRSLRGVMRPHYTPKLKKRMALLRALKEVFCRYRSQSIERVISLINPMLRGWVNYFAVGHSGECFNYIKDWVEKKVSRHMAHARKRKGFGWERWSRPWLYDTLKLFNSYRVRRDGPKACPSMIGPISLEAKRMGARSAGNPHAVCDVEGAGNVAGMGMPRPHRRASPRPYLGEAEGEIPSAYSPRTL